MNYKGKPWTYYSKKSNPRLLSKEALDLLDCFLKFDHEERILPKEAMKHPYFEPVIERRAQAAKNKENSKVDS